MTRYRHPALPRLLSDFMLLRGPEHLAPREAERLRVHLVGLAKAGSLPPSAGERIDWPAIAKACGIAPDTLLAAGDGLAAGLQTVWRKARRPAVRRPRPAGMARPVGGPVPDPYPQADDRHGFAGALTAQMAAHGDTPGGLRAALAADGLPVKTATLTHWALGDSAPARGSSYRVLAWLEARWALQAGYFRRRLPQLARAPDRAPIANLSAAQRRVLLWHLPEDFEQRSSAEQEAILDWIRRAVLGGATEFGRFQAAVRQHPYGLQFPAQRAQWSRPQTARRKEPVRSATILAPPALAAELDALIAFKTAPLTPIGFERRGVWRAESVVQKIKHFGLLFGALAASAEGPARGRGLPPEALTFGLLAFPAVWDWYLQWRDRRRGFLTTWELDMLNVAAALTKAGTGWLAQTPALGERLQPIAGLLAADDIARARADWAGTCARMKAFALSRAQDVGRIIRVHRDPFEAILPVLEADSPVGEYRKIADEILRLAPCPRRYPLAAAESARAFLMIRLGLHLGFRQKNLRELLLCRPGDAPRSEGELTGLCRGELRWRERGGGWEVFAPVSAFKNAGSSYFSGQPFRLRLADIGGLYAAIDAYIRVHRGRLLGAAPDSGTFFVKTAKAGARDGAYDQKSFYEAWRWIILRYGVHNPYTGRGAIAGLLPHGPHRVRDVLATHVLRQTGSFEQASFAIQDTPQTVAQPYARFRPQDKAAIAANIVNRAWDD